MWIQRNGNQKPALIFLLSSSLLIAERRKHIRLVVISLWWMLWMIRHAKLLNWIQMDDDEADFWEVQYLWGHSLKKPTLPNAPTIRMTPFRAYAQRLFLFLCLYSTPIALLPSNIISEAKAWFMMCRLGLSLAGINIVLFGFVHIRVKVDDSNHQSLLHQEQWEIENSLNIFTTNVYSRKLKNHYLVQ